MHNDPHPIMTLKLAVLEGATLDSESWNMDPYAIMKAFGTLNSRVRMISLE